MTDIDGIKARSIGDANSTIFALLDQLDAAQEALRLADAALLRATYNGHDVSVTEFVGDEVMDAVFAREAARARQEEP